MCVCYTKPVRLFSLSFSPLLSVPLWQWRSLGGHTCACLLTVSFFLFLFTLFYSVLYSKSFKVNRWSTYLHSRSALLFNTTCHHHHYHPLFIIHWRLILSLSLFFFFSSNYIKFWECFAQTQLVEDSNFYKVVLVWSIPGLVSLACVGSQKKKKTNCGCIHFSFSCRLSFQCKYVRFLIFLISEKSANHRQNHKVLSINKFASLPLCVWLPPESMRFFAQQFFLLSSFALSGRQGCIHSLGTCSIFSRQMFYLCYSFAFFMRQIPKRIHKLLECIGWSSKWKVVGRLERVSE